jgi:hypothetical protein
VHDLRRGIKFEFKPIPILPLSESCAAVSKYIHTYMSPPHLTFLRFTRR